MMETRVFILIAAVILFAASITLARGSMKTADEAIAERDACQKQRVRHVREIPRIVVGAQSIVYRGEFVAPIDVVMQDMSTRRIETLFVKLKRDRALTCDSTAVCLDNLVVLEALSTTDINLINMISLTAWAAGYDLVVARPRNLNSW